MAIQHVQVAFARNYVTGLLHNIIVCWFLISTMKVQIQFSTYCALFPPSAFSNMLNLQTVSKYNTTPTPPVFSRLHLFSLSICQYYYSGSTTWRLPSDNKLHAKFFCVKYITRAKRTRKKRYSRTLRLNNI